MGHESWHFSRKRDFLPVSKVYESEMSEFTRRTFSVNFDYKVTRIYTDFLALVYARVS